MPETGGRAPAERLAALFPDAWGSREAAPVSWCGERESGSLAGPKADDRRSGFHSRSAGWIRPITSTGARTPMSRRLVPAALCAAFAMLAFGAGPGWAVPPTCDPTEDPCEPTTYTDTATRKLTVQVPVGTVVSQPAGIDCTASTCSKSVTVSRECDGSFCEDWPAATTFTLTASGGPSGYSPAWSDCAGHGSCTVSLGDEGMGAALETVTLAWVDTTAPSTTFAPPAKVGPSDFHVSAGAADNSGAIAAFAWTVDGVAQGATGSVLSLSGLANGKHSVAVRSRDAAGNWSGTVTKDVVVDKAVSATPAALPAVTSAATVPLTFTEDADVVKSECSLDGGAYVACASGWSGITAATADGVHSYKVRVTDDVGNVAETAAVSTTIDRTQPVLAFTDGPAEGQQVVTRTASITFSLVEPRPGSVECKLDAGAWSACTPGTPVQLADLADGTHVFSVQAVDTAGNTRTISRTFGVSVPATGGGGETPGDEQTPGGGGQAPTGGGGQAPTGGGGQPTTGGGAPSTPQPAALNVRFNHDYVYVGKRTRFTSLRIAGLPKSAKVTVTCKGGGCKVGRKTLEHSGGRLNVLKALRSLKLKAGAKLTITVRGEGGAQAVARYVIRGGKRPTDTYRCAKPGGKLAAC
jgi:hypothetical protein